MDNLNITLLYLYALLMLHWRQIGAVLVVIIVGLAAGIYRAKRKK